MPQFHEEQTDFNGANAILKTSSQYYSTILVPFLKKVYTACNCGT